MINYELSIVWSALPGFTQLVPIIGHTSIGSSLGQTSEFTGSNEILKDHFIFGKPLKIIKLYDIEDEERFDKCIDEANKVYQGRGHNLFTDNCHSHVAMVLNLYKYRGRSNHTMVSVWWMCATQGKYVSWSALFRTFWPCLVIWVIPLFIFVVAMAAIYI